MNDTVTAGNRSRDNSRRAVLQRLVMLGFVESRTKYILCMEEMINRMDYRTELRQYD